MNRYQKFLTLAEIIFIAIIIYIIGIKVITLKYIVPTSILYLILIYVLKGGSMTKIKYKLIEG